MIHVITTRRARSRRSASSRPSRSCAGVDRAAAVGVGPAGTQQVVVVVVPDATAPPAGSRAAAPLAEQVRAAMRVDVAAVLVVPALPVDKRHNSKIDRTRVARWATRRARRRTDARAVKVLVTGATSLLGGAVARAAARSGRRRHGVPAPTRAGWACAKCSATSPTARAVEAAVAGADVVIHAAAKVDVIGPWSAFEATNIAGTANMLEASRGRVGRPLRVRLVAVGRPRGPVARRRPGRAGRPRPRRVTTTRAARRSPSVSALAAGTGGLSVVAVRPHLVWGPGDTQLVGRIVTPGPPGPARDRRLRRGVDRHHLHRQRRRCDRRRRRSRRPVERARARRLERTAAAGARAAEPDRTWRPASRRLGCASRPGWPARAGTVLERVWDRLRRDDEPPITQFPRRTAVDRALVRPARDPAGARVATRGRTSTRVSPASRPGCGADRLSLRCSLAGSDERT